MATLSPKGSETKLRIIRTAAELFHAHGMHATSPDAIIEASNTGKGQFYHYFKSKEGLIHEVLLWHLDAIESGTSNINYDVRSWNDLETWFLAHVEQQKRFEMARGCIFGTAANELTEGEEDVRADLVRIFDAIQCRLAAFFATEKALKRLDESADEMRLAAFCIGVVQGAMLVGKVRRDSAGVEAIIRVALAHLSRYRSDL